MLKKQIQELLDICKEVDYEYDVLMQLSEQNKEDTSDYEEHLELLNFYVLTGLEYCQNCPLNVLEKMLSNINKLTAANPDNYSYIAAANTISYVLDKKYIESRNGNQEENVDEDLDEDCYKCADEEIPEENKYFEEYPNELDDLYDEAMSIIYVNATRNVVKKLRNIKPQNEYETKYKKQLVKLYQTRYKYDYLASSISLELIAIKAHFNPFRIHIILDETDYRPIYFNEAIGIIQNLYQRKNTHTNPEDVMEDYFSIECLEEIFRHLDIERLSKLKDMCQDLSISSPENNYGDICLRKIKERLS